jgi:hypothetical protein
MTPINRLFTVLPQSEYEAAGRHAVITLLGSATKVTGERLLADEAAMVPLLPHLPPLSEEALARLRDECIRTVSRLKQQKRPGNRGVGGRRPGVTDAEVTEDVEPDAPDVVAVSVEAAVQEATSSVAVLPGLVVRSGSGLSSQRSGSSGAGGGEADSVVSEDSRGSYTDESEVEVEEAATTVTGFGWSDEEEQSAGDNDSVAGVRSPSAACTSGHSVERCPASPACAQD